MCVMSCVKSKADLVHELLPDTLLGLSSSRPLGLGLGPSGLWGGILSAQGPT